MGERGVSTGKGRSRGKGHSIGSGDPTPNRTPPNQDPFASLYRDADIEAMSAGWDDGSAYGYNHVIDDPAMGFTRFCHGSRIVAYEPGLFYAAPTTEAVAFALRMELQVLGPTPTPYPTTPTPDPTPTPTPNPNP